MNDQTDRADSNGRKRATYRARDEPGGGFPLDRTALLVIDPVNDFLSEGGAAWELTKNTVKLHDVIGNIKRSIEGARERGIPVLFGPMAYTEEDYAHHQLHRRTGINRIMFERKMSGGHLREGNLHTAGCGGEAVRRPGLHQRPQAGGWQDALEGAADTRRSAGEAGPAGGGGGAPVPLAVAVGNSRRRRSLRVLSANRGHGRRRGGEHARRRLRRRLCGRRASVPGSPRYFRFGEGEPRARLISSRTGTGLDR
jgi:hypothetical protein